MNELAFSQRGYMPGKLCRFLYSALLPPLTAGYTNDLVCDQLMI